MKKYIILIITVLAFSLPAGASEHHEWKLIANSSLIITGKIDVPIAAIDQATKTGKHSYVEFKVNNVHTIKGEYRENDIIISYYTEKREYAPYPELIKSLNGKDVLLFLQYVSDDYGTSGDYYFAGYSKRSVAAVDKNTIRLIQSEINHQNKILSTNLEDIYSDKDFNKKVTLIIEDMLSPKKARNAYKNLEELGDKAVPYIIMNMDDRRELPVKQISLVNKSPNAFEGIRHYGPKQVVDALSAILNQITGESFFSIHNGSSEEVRTEDVKAWKIWLNHKQLTKTK
jgi:hypothetical protein